MKITSKHKDAIDWYIKNKDTYYKLAKKVESIILEILSLENLSHHIVNSRAKDVDSFKKKVETDKYHDPINQVTDLAGIRIITYVEDEVGAISKVIEETFDVDSENSLDKSKELGIDKVGYKSIHYVAKIKSDRLKLPEYKIFKNMRFEIQIRTILQHAWAEIEHDRNYKFSGKLPNEISRRFKLLAGTLEILDREFNNISKEIDIISNEVKEGTIKGHLDFDINSTSLKQYLETKFQILWDRGFEYNLEVSEHLLDEIRLFGISNLKELDNIIPQDFAIQIKDYESKEMVITAFGLVRAAMIINNYKKYFDTCWRNNWSQWSTTNGYENLFKHYNIEWDIIVKEYGIPFS